MDKKYVTKIIPVLLGIALITLIFSFFSLLFDAIFMDDVILLNTSTSAEAKDLNEIVPLLKWTTVSLACILVPVFVCYVFAYFGNGKIFNTVSAVLSLFITATCIAFVFVLREEALITKSATIYSAVAESFENFIMLAANSAILCAFFIYNSAASFKKQPDGNLATENAEVSNSEKV